MRAALFETCSTNGPSRNAVECNISSLLGILATVQGTPSAGRAPDRLATCHRSTLRETQLSNAHLSEAARSTAASPNIPAQGHLVSSSIEATNTAHSKRIHKD